LQYQGGLGHPDEALVLVVHEHIDRVGAAQCSLALERRREHQLVEGDAPAGQLGASVVGPRRVAVSQHQHAVPGGAEGGAEQGEDGGPLRVGAVDVEGDDHEGCFSAAGSSPWTCSKVAAGSTFWRWPMTAGRKRCTCSSDSPDFSSASSAPPPLPLPKSFPTN